MKQTRQRQYILVSFALKSVLETYTESGKVRGSMRALRTILKMLGGQEKPPRIAVRKGMVIYTLYFSFPSEISLQPDQQASILEHIFGLSDALSGITRSFRYAKSDGIFSTRRRSQN
jgi:hypothetical protein